MANFLACVALATLSTMLIYHGSSADLTVFIFFASKYDDSHHATIPDKTDPKQVPPPPTPTFNNDNQVIFTFLLEKPRSFARVIRGDGGYVMQLEPKCPGYCLKEICGEFPNEGNTSDCCGVTKLDRTSLRYYRLRLGVNICDNS